MPLLEPALASHVPSVSTYPALAVSIAHPDLPTWTPVRLRHVSHAVQDSSQPLPLAAAEPVQQARTITTLDRAPLQAHCVLTVQLAHTLRPVPSCARHVHQDTPIMITTLALRVLAMSVYALLDPSMILRIIAAHVPRAGRGQTVQTV